MARVNLKLSTLRTSSRNSGQGSLSPDVHFRALKLLNLFGALRLAQFGQLMWPESSDASQRSLASKVTKKLKDNYAHIAVKDSGANDKIFHLTSSGLDFLNTVFSYEEHYRGSPDELSLDGNNFKHNQLGVEYLIHRAVNGDAVYPEAYLKRNLGFRAINADKERHPTLHYLFHEFKTSIEKRSGLKQSYLNFMLKSPDGIVFYENPSFAPSHAHSFPKTFYRQDIFKGRRSESELAHQQRKLQVTGTEDFIGQSVVMAPQLFDWIEVENARKTSQEYQFVFESFFNYLKVKAAFDMGFHRTELPAQQGREDVRKAPSFQSPHFLEAAVFSSSDRTNGIVERLYNRSMFGRLIFVCDIRHEHLPRIAEGFALLKSAWVSLAKDNPDKFSFAPWDTADKFYIAALSFLRENTHVFFFEGNSGFMFRPGNLVPLKNLVEL